VTHNWVKQIIFWELFFIRKIMSSVIIWMSYILRTIYLIIFLIRTWTWKGKKKRQYEI
jgi:hypothetical protein